MGAPTTSGAGGSPLAGRSEGWHGARHEAAGRTQVLTALLRSFAQLGDPRIRRVVWLSLGATLTLLLALVTVLWVLIVQWQLIAIGWLDAVLDAAAGLAVLVLAWFLFPAIASSVAGFFLEEVAEAVEARHYPGLPPARPQPMIEAVFDSLRFAGLALLLNLLFLPLYLVLLFLPPLNLVVFYGLNGYLLGREYFELAAVRRLERSRIRALRRAYRGRLFLAGALIAVLLTVPLVNLVAPIIGTALMVHVLEMLRRRAGRFGGPAVG